MLPTCKVRMRKADGAIYEVALSNLDVMLSTDHSHIGNPPFTCSTCSTKGLCYLQHQQQSHETEFLPVLHLVSWRVKITVPTGSSRLIIERIDIRLSSIRTSLGDTTYLTCPLYGARECHFRLLYLPSSKSPFARQLVRRTNVQAARPTACS